MKVYTEADINKMTDDGDIDETAINEIQEAISNGRIVLYQMSPGELQWLNFVKGRSVI